MFALGVIVGLLVAILNAVLYAIFSAPTHSVTERIYREIQENAKQIGLGQIGFIVDPIDEAEETRQERIRENNELGRDTPLSELRDEA